MSKDRVKLDIDTDFEDATREKVLDYVRYKYGDKKVAKIITFGTAAAKNSIRSVVRVLNLPVSLGNKIANYIPKTPGITIDKSLEENFEFKEAYETDEEVRKIVDYAKQFEGLKTNRSIHACANLICPDNVIEHMPEVKLRQPGGNELYWTTALTGPEVEERGLLKMDFLGLRTLGVAHEAIDLIKKDKGVDIVYDEIPLFDLNNYENLAKGNTEAVFQVESNYFTETLLKAYVNLDERVKKINEETDSAKKAELAKSLGQECFDRLCALNALTRPGPQAYIPDYCRNLLNPEEIKYDDPSVVEELKSTYGIMLYQEQAMNLCKTMAGFSDSQSDTVRKGMAKKHKEILDEYKEYFVSGSKEKNIKGCVANGIDEKVARKVWDDMLEFSRYGFNKSHAVAYSMHSARTGWLSYYYPVEYMTAVLNSYSNNFDKIKGYLVACKNKDIPMYNPDINHSYKGFTPEADGIRFGIGSLKNVGSAAEGVITEREARGEFTSYTDFLYRMAKYQPGCIKKNMLESFIYAGLLDEYPGTRKDKIEHIEETIDFVKQCKELGKDRYSIFDLLGADVEKEMVQYSQVDTGEEFDLQTLLRNENEFAGFFISGHPLDEFEKELKAERVVNVSDLIDDDEQEERYRNLNNVKVAGVIRESKKRISKNTGKIFYTFEIEDKTGVLKAVHFNKEQDASLEELIQDGNVVYAVGRISTDDFGTQISVNEIENINVIKANFNFVSVSLIGLTKNEEEREELLNQVRTMFATKYGTTNLYYRDGNEWKKILRYPVVVSIGNYNKLKEMFGSDNVRVRKKDV